MIKAIFFDIDGTLVSFKNHQIPASTIESLKKLKEKGIKIFVATGRGKDGLDILDEIEFDGYITLNGQYCYVDNQIIYENTIKRDDLQKLLNYLEDHPFPCGFTEEHNKYFNLRDARVDEIHRITLNDDHPAGDCSDVVNKKIYQCMCFIDEQEEQKLMQIMPNCISARWHPLFCDVSPKGGTKQNGIDKFLDFYGGNDIEMLQHVALSVAMENGNDKVKEIADYVTADVDEDGILKALQYFSIL